MFGPDGFHYGVRFGDGSVADRWNGSTQERRAREYLAELRAEYPRTAFDLVRCRRGGSWEVVREIH